MRQKGFAPLFIIIIVFVVALGGVGYSVYKNSNDNNQKIETSQATPTVAVENSENAEVSGEPTKTSSPTKKPTVQPTKKPSATPTTTQTSSGSSNTSCSYNLTVSTGAVKVNIQAQSGIIVGDQTVELKAQTGCNVLVNKSTDKDTRIARQGSPTVDFSSVPPGSYSVRAQYKGQWTSYLGISVSSAQQTTVTITVTGDAPTSAPTSAPKPKPTCYNPIIYPSSTGTAPYNALLQGQGMGGAAGSMVAYEWDFESSGTWYTDGTTNAPYHTYANPGTYTVKMRLLASNGEYSDVCQSTVTVN